MKNLIIIGAGGCGREVLQWAKDVNKHASTWNIKGFLDDNPDALSGKNCASVIVSAVDDYMPATDDVFVCAVANPSFRKQAVERLKSRGAVFTNVIHPTAIVSDNSRLGEGTVLYPFTVITDNAVLNDFCIINKYSTAAHDVVLGEYCTVSAFCDITGHCTLGDYVFMGTGSKLTPGVNIGDSAFICAGSVVFGNIKPGVKVLGNPARRVNI